MKEFSETLKELRKEKGITQETLGSIIHVSRSAIAKYENGLGLPSEEIIKSICDYFEVSREYLFPKDDVEKIIVEKNIKINSQKRKLIIITGSLSLILIILFAVIACLKLPKENHTILNNEIMNIDIKNPNDYQKDIVLFQYKGGYVYQRIEIHKMEFTDNTNLYLLRVCNTYTNGHVAFELSDSSRFNKNEFTKEVYMGINLLPSPNLRPIISWEQKHSNIYYFSSQLNPNGEILLDEKKSLFDGAYIERASDKIRFVYNSTITDYLFDYEYNTILRKCTINNGYYNSNWTYEMLEDRSELLSFSIFSSYLFEATPNQIINFEVDTKMVNTNMSIEQKKIFNLKI